MARAKKQTEPDTSFNIEEFDPAMQPEAAAIVNQVAASTEMPAEQPVTGHIANPSSTRREPNTAAGYTANVKRREYKPLPDPFGGIIIDLTNDPKGMKARFLRSKQHEDMWIQFSENPGKEITDQIREAGFRWESKAQSDFVRGAWVLPLEPGSEWRNHAHAEEVFKDVVNQIRERNGMEPFVSGAGQSAG